MSIVYKQPADSVSSDMDTNTDTETDTETDAKQAQSMATAVKTENGENRISDAEKRRMSERIKAMIDAKGTRYQFRVKNKAPTRQG